jgi:hypothetical protein
MQKRSLQQEQTYQRLGEARNKTQRTAESPRCGRKSSEYSLYLWFGCYVEGSRTSNSQSS